MKCEQIKSRLNVDFFFRRTFSKKNPLWWKIIATDHEKDEWFFPYVFGLVIILFLMLGVYYFVRA